ncbi:unnamed protein product [Anisakis simplex]|uniref:BTB domain-containing protein n=1 Tax=Anisakis simplex TaxID=6269 RepID=A0A0M3JV34_ANISI|nr:unnamed protein product [Anisakis simplex]
MPIQSETPTVLKANEYGRALSLRLQELRKEGRYVDCKIRLETADGHLKELRAHRNVLASGSNFFKEAFNMKEAATDDDEEDDDNNDKNKTNESDLTLKLTNDGAVSCFESLLDFLYCGLLDTSKNDPDSLMQIAKLYQVKEAEQLLEPYCSNLLPTSTSTSSCTSAPLSTQLPTLPSLFPPQSATLEALMNGCGTSAAVSSSPSTSLHDLNASQSYNNALEVQMQIARIAAAHRLAQPQFFPPPFQLLATILPSFSSQFTFPSTSLPSLLTTNSTPSSRSTPSNGSSRKRKKTVLYYCYITIMNIVTVVYNIFLCDLFNELAISFSTIDNNNFQNVSENNQNECTGTTVKELSPSIINEPTEEISIDENSDTFDNMGDIIVPSSDREGWCRNKKYIERVANGFMCSVCHKVYGRYNSVSYHVTIYHRNPPIKCDEEGCSRKCPFCRHISKSPAMLDKHISRHMSDCTRNGTQLKCPQCDINLSTQKDMLDHISKQHQHQDCINFHCDQCNYRGQSEISLKQHISFKHSAEMFTKKMTCKLCQYGCMEEMNLKEHYQRMHPQHQFDDEKDCTCDHEQPTNEVSNSNSEEVPRGESPATSTIVSLSCSTKENGANSCGDNTSEDEIEEQHDEEEDADKKWN